MEFEEIESKGRDTMRFTTIVLLTCLATGCASQQRLRDSGPLPFHVAVIPVDVKPDTGMTPQEIEESGDPLEIELVIDGQGLSQQIVDSLNGSAFIKATLLPPLEGPPSEDYFAQAKKNGADLILSCNLSHQGKVYGRPNDWFWFNHAIFLFGGPLTWLPNDRSFDTVGSLAVRLHDPTKLEQNPRFWANPAEAISAFQVPFSEVTMDFIDRAPNLGTYALSIVWPSGRLANDNELVKEELQTILAETLTGEVNASFQDQSPGINQSILHYKNHLDLKSIRIIQDQTNSVSIALDVILMATRGVTGLTRYTIEVEGLDPLVAELDDDEDRIEDPALSTTLGGSNFSVYRYHLEKTLTPPGPVKTIRIRIEEAGTDPKSRSFTLPVTRAIPTS